MQKASGFKIDERVYNIKRRRGWQAQIEELAREIEYFENVVKVFKIFKLNLNIHINKLSEIERQNINILIGAFVEGKHIRFNSPYPSAGPQDLQVGLEKVKLFFTATSKRDVFRVEDFFKFNGKFERTNPVTNETWETSPFVILTKDDLVNVVNIDFSILLPSFQQLQDPRVKSDANQLFLNLLSAYDECEKNNRTERAALLMEVADAFNDWLLWLDPTQPVERLNRLQIIKRKRPLTTEEEETAIKISEEENDKIFRFAACALLNERARAQKLWREFSQEEQKIVKSWPIARFVDDEKFPILLKEQETSLVPLGPAIPQETVPTPPAEPRV